MNFKKILLAAFVLQSFALNSYAENRDSEDAVFNESIRGEGSQIILGIAEVWAASSLWPTNSTTSTISKAILQAEKDLEATNEIFTTEEERKRAIKALKENPLNYTSGNVTHVDDLEEEALNRLEKLKSSPLMSAADKSLLIEQASKNLTETRMQALQALKVEGTMDKSVRILKYSASTLLIADALGRIYVWNVLERNPTFSPGAQYLKHLLTEE